MAKARRGKGRRGDQSEVKMAEGGVPAGEAAEFAAAGDAREEEAYEEETDAAGAEGLVLEDGKMDAEIDAEADFGTDDAVSLTVALKARDKQSSERELVIRRAIEERREARRMKEDLDYLDLED